MAARSRQMLLRTAGKAQVQVWRRASKELVGFHYRARIVSLCVQGLREQRGVFALHRL